MKTIAIYFLFVIAFPFFLANAAEPISEIGRLCSFAGFQGTSDKIYNRSLSICYDRHRRDPSWSYPDEAENAWDLGADATINKGSSPPVDFTGGKIQLKAGRKFSSKFYSWMKGGFHQVKNKNPDQKSDRVIYSSGVAAPVSDSFYASADFSHDLTYEELLVSKSITDPLTADTLNLTIVMTNPEFLRSSFRGQYKGYSDKNEKRAFDLESKFRIAPKEYWIWLGAGLNYINHTNLISGYWTPKNFTSYGPRFEASVDIIKDISGALSLNYNRLKEDYSPWGAGYFFLAALQYGKRDKPNLRLEYERIQSIQNSLKWFSNRYQLNLTTFF